MHLLEHFRAQGPFVQFQAADSKGVIQILPQSGAKSIE